MRRSISRRPRRSTAPRRALILAPCASRPIRRASRCVASARTARSNGAATSSSSARRASANRSRSRRPRRANGWFASPTSSSATSTRPAASAAASYRDRRPVESWTTPRRCPQAHRRNSSNKIPPCKGPKVSTMYPAQNVNHQTGCTPAGKPSRFRSPASIPMPNGSRTPSLNSRTSFAGETPPAAIRRPGRLRTKRSGPRPDLPKRRPRLRSARTASPSRGDQKRRLPRPLGGRSRAPSLSWPSLGWRSLQESCCFSRVRDRTAKGGGFGAPPASPPPAPALAPASNAVGPDEWLTLDDFRAELNQKASAGYQPDMMSGRCEDGVIKYHAHWTQKITRTSLCAPARPV